MPAAASILPSSKPRLSSDALLQRMAPFAIDRERYPIVVAGIRAYYRDSMGVAGVNDRNLYDDAIFVHTPSAMVAFNGNTDASKVRKGWGILGEKGMAMLKAGCWYAHGFGNHKGYPALIQRHAEVTVVRDGKDGDYEDKGWFGINIHRGGRSTTGSEGCQTLHPDQWDAFINLVTSEAHRLLGDRWRDAVIPYVLTENAQA
jgi:lysozyme